MADTLISYDEIRFDVRDEQITHCYVLIRNLSNDGMLGVQGWHHKAFPARMSVTDIMLAWQKGDEDPLMWPLQAPSELFGRLIEQIEVERGSEPRHDYPACAIFRGGKCTCDAQNVPRCQKCGGTHDGGVSCLGPYEPPRPPGHTPMA